MKPELPAAIKQAIAESESNQAEAWLNFNTTIAGIEVTQMTIKQFFMLDGIESPYLNQGSPTPPALALFLWILSPKYNPTKEAREKFCEEIFTLQIEQATKDIQKYLIATFQDAEADGKDDKRYANYLTYLIDLFGREYGWRPAEVMQMPMRQLYQLNTAIGERYARAAGEKYTKLRAIDMMEAEALLAEARKAKKAE